MMGWLRNTQYQETSRRLLVRAIHGGTSITPKTSGPRGAASRRNVANYAGRKSQEVARPATKSHKGLSFPGEGSFGGYALPPDMRDPFRSLCFPPVGSCWSVTVSGPCGAPGRHIVPMLLVGLPLRRISGKVLGVVEDFLLFGHLIFLL